MGSGLTKPTTLYFMVPPEETVLEEIRRKKREYMRTWVAKNRDHVNVCQREKYKVRRLNSVFVEKHRASGRTTARRLWQKVKGSPVLLEASRVVNRENNSKYRLEHPELSTKWSRVCIECGRDFNGRYSQKTCGPECESAVRSKTQVALLEAGVFNTSGHTSIELAVWGALESLGMSVSYSASGMPTMFKAQWALNGKFCLDFACPELKVAVECDGDYWHANPATKYGKGKLYPRQSKLVANDKKKDAYLKACGWEVLHFWESDILVDPIACAAKVKDLLSKRKK